MLVAAAAAWLCQRIGLPVVIGYITAGILIGPHTHLFTLLFSAHDSEHNNAVALKEFLQRRIRTPIPDKRKGAVSRRPHRK